MSIYLDTSAMVKFFHIEQGTDAVSDLILNNINEIYLSELSRLEFISAIQRRYRNKEINKENLLKTIKAFDKEIRLFKVEPITRLIIGEAEGLLKKYGSSYGLRTLDSIHMATFMLIKDKDWLFVASDKILIELAIKIGINYFNPQQ